MSELQSLMKDKQIEFKAMIAPSSDKLAVVCDPKRVGQVIANLVKNSVDFVPDRGGKITMKVSKSAKSDDITFSFEDNGAGIPPEKIDNLFKSFYQIDTSVTRKHGGTGLGLAICKGIIEGHDGKIWVDKDYSGGLSISFTLPIADTSSNKNQNSSNEDEK